MKITIKTFFFTKVEILWKVMVNFISTSWKWMF